MTVHACVAALAILLGASIGSAMDEGSFNEPGLLVAADSALSDIERLSVVLAAQETPGVRELIDVPRLQAQVVRRLREAGIEPATSETGPKLVVQIEGIAVADCSRYAYRVQTSLNRVATLSDYRDVRVEAEVWRLRPMMKAVTLAEAGEQIAAAVLTQVEAFAGVHKAARRLGPRPQAGGPNVPAAKTPDPAGSASQNLQAVPRHPFVASRSSSVFHRPDCRWAQNISDDNRIGYATREEALQAGKRPCKSCKP